jgi:hypothetical protein
MMIISHKHKYIFVKTTKTAGTSIEIGLSKFCGEDDIITPISRADEIIRMSLGYRGPQNCKIPITRYTMYDYSVLFRKRRRARFFNHISARSIQRHIGEDVWNSYFKFCFERHPYDRVVSLYFWRYKKEPRPSLSHFISSGEFKRLKKRGLDLYTIDGRVVVDRVCRYEDMSKELQHISTILRFDDVLEIPRAKSSPQSPRLLYRELLTTEDKQEISIAFRDEATLMKYEM